MIILKTDREIELMRQGGRIAAAVVEEVSRRIKPGVSAWEIDRIAERFIRERGAKPSFQGFEGYRFATCINVNKGVVHGLPKKQVVFCPGDVVKVDLGVLYRGFNTDTAFSCLVKGGPGEMEKERFLETGRRALSAALKTCRVGRHIGDISAQIQRVIEGGGYSVVRELVGHGVGRQLHEDPQIPGLGQAGTGPLLKSGMTLAIEVIYAQGRGEIVEEDDGWTLSSADDTIAGLFEQTVALSQKGVETLTLGPCLC